MSEYFKFKNGTKMITVYDLDDCLTAIKQRHEDQELRIEDLLQENKKLHDEHYKDDTIQDLQKQIDKLEAENRRGFPISESEWDTIEKWKDKHDVEKHGLNTLDKKLKAGGAIGGRYSYHFVPTSIGTVGTVKCKCGAEFTFQEPW